MTYKIVTQSTKQKEVNFEHCIIDKGQESQMWDIVKNVPADFHSIELFEVKGFAHVTRTENIEAIKENGLIYTRNSLNHLGDGNYCLTGESFVDYGDIINFLKFISHIDNKEDYSIVFGYYIGNILYCINGFDNHRGYSVLLEDVPKEQITTSISLHNFGRQNVIEYLKQEIALNSKLADELVLKEMDT